MNELSGLALLPNFSDYDVHGSATLLACRM